MLALGIAVALAACISGAIISELVGGHPLRVLPSSTKEDTHVCAS